jgi:hypothetical protein
MHKQIKITNPKQSPDLPQTLDRTERLSQMIYQKEHITTQHMPPAFASICCFVHVWGTVFLPPFETVSPRSNPLVVVCRRPAVQRQFHALSQPTVWTVVSKYAFLTVRHESMKKAEKRNGSGTSHHIRRHADGSSDGKSTKLTFHSDKFPILISVKGLQVA